MSLPWFPEDLPDPVPPPQGGCIVTFTGKLPRESCAFTRTTADQRPIMTRGQRFASFKLVRPDVVISPDKRSATWADAAGPHHEAFEDPESLLRFLEETFGVTSA